MVAAVADVDSNPAVDGCEDSVAGVALHVVGGLVEVAHPGDVVLPGLPETPPGVVDDDGRVPERVAVVLVPLQYGGDDDHPVLGCQLQGNSKEEL